MIAYRTLVRGIGMTAMLFALAFTAGTAGAQFPDTYTNLQVLPKETSKSELQATMRGFAFALGVRCEYCHMQNANKEFNYAADDKNTKKTARVMLQMVAAINHDYMSKIGKEEPVRVECATCHHGLTKPRQLKAVLAEAIDNRGIDGAVALYHDLRKQYYGSGQYDFGELPLNQLTETLLAKKQNKEAVAIMEMNFAENNPTSVYSYHVLAMAHQANGEIDKAIADYRKVVELHPDDDWAKSQIDALSKPQ